MTPESKSILITTIAARQGGVPAMLRFAIDALRRNGWDPHLAYYEPYSQSPELSVPVQALVRRAVSSRREEGIGGTKATAVGAWLPELEFTHYRPSAQWRELIAGFPMHLVISGTAIAGAALASLGKPFVAWLATDLEGDRCDRVGTFPWYRRMLDQGLNVHVLRAQERRVIHRAHVLALSKHTEGELNRIAGRKVVREVLPAPIDTRIFKPKAGFTTAGRIGFSGRLDDPRKNVALLLDSMVDLAHSCPESELVLIGHRPGTPLEAWIAARGLDARVKLLPYVAPEQLPEILAELDVFAVPSHQEGLCIAALEAMACGVPVISTRCGGPEDFISNGHNGWLVEANARDLADALRRVIKDRASRLSMGIAARRTIESHYSIGSAEKILMGALNQTFPNQIRSLCA